MALELSILTLNNGTGDVPGAATWVRLQLNRDEWCFFWTGNRFIRSEIFYSA